jgi:hypothetical protein
MRELSASDDNVPIVITGTSGTGIAVVDLTSIPEPSALPYNRQIISRSHNPVGSGESRKDWQNQRVLATRRTHSATVQLRTVPHVIKPFRAIDK